MSRQNNEFILVKFDVSGIQDYIFATNRLRENAGASYQVTKVLEEFLEKALLYDKPQRAVASEEVVLKWRDADQLRLPKNENIRAEIIYSGGGNAIVLFRDFDMFQKTAEKLGRIVAENSQGLSLAAAYIKTKLENFGEDRKKLELEMSRRKREMIRQPLISPFPVVEQDYESHQPIVRCTSSGTWTGNMTRIQRQKQEAYEEAEWRNTGSREKSRSLFPRVGRGISYRYPETMEHLCQKPGEDSRIAVVHIDGNGMGDRINRQIERYSTYTEGVPGIRKVSKEIAELFQNTYAEVLNDLWKRDVFDTAVFERKVSQKDEAAEQIFVPLRPMILDGDDFTFLCRADLAVPVAVDFMMKLMQNQKEEPRITACGGIAFVHSHFPFRVAYSIAEESCSCAKEKWYAQKKARPGEKSAVCCLDFQVIKESEAEQQTKGRGRQKRPYTISQKDNRKNGDSLRELYDTLKKMEDWPSGRLHRMYRAIQEGEVSMEFLQREFASRGYRITDLTQEEWQNSPLFDALELRGLCHMDLLREFL